MIDAEITSADHYRRNIPHHNKKSSFTDNRQDVDQSTNANSLSKSLAENITAVVGLKEAITARRWWIKTAWIIFLIAGTAATIYYVYQASQDYMNEPTAIKVNFKGDSEIDYPPFQVCAPNWCNVEQASADGLTIDALKFSLGYMRNAIFSLKTDQLNDSTKAEEAFGHFYRTKNFGGFQQYLQYLTLNASFGEQPEDDGQLLFSCHHCNESAGIRKVLRDSGICHEFQWNRLNIKTARSDRLPSLIVSSPDRSQQLFLGSNMLFIYIREGSTSIPLPFAYNTFSILFLSRQRFRRLNTVSEPCLDDDRYSYERCMDSCYGKTAIKLSGCELFNDNEDNRGQSIDQYCNEYSPQKMFDFDKHHNSILESCADHCPVPCKTTLYQIGIEPLKPPEYSPDVLPINHTKTEFWMVDTSIVSGPIVEFFEVSTYSFATLVGNVGGMLGIFIGCTLMTFVQLTLSITEYLIDRLQQAIAHKKTSA